jgi:hypothetical protein
MAGWIQIGADLYSVKVSAQVNRGGLGATSPYEAVDLLRSVCADHKIYTDSPNEETSVITSPDLPPGTLVVTNRRLGRIVKPAQIGAATGYTITTTPEVHEGYAPHFVEAYAVQVAGLGVNVCRTRRGQCFCGLVHVTAPELEDLHQATPVETVTAQGELL